MLILRFEETEAGDVRWDLQDMLQRVQNWPYFRLVGFVIDVALLQVKDVYLIPGTSALMAHDTHGFASSLKGVMHVKVILHE